MRGRNRDQPRQIGEIAVPPVTAGAQRVKLHGDAPDPSPIALKGALRHGRIEARWLLSARHVLYQEAVAE